MSAAARYCAAVITLGPWHERPWWWEQLLPAQRDAISYHRMSLDDKTHRQLGMLDVPRLAARLARILRQCRREGTQYVVTFESDMTCYLIGLLQWLPGLGAPRHVIVQFISREMQATWSSRLKNLVQKICLHTVHRLVCSSRSEAAYYQHRFGWPEGKTVFVPLLSDERYLAHHCAHPLDTIVAAGRSYRDYGTLAQAVRGTGIRTIIVGGRKLQQQGAQQFPAEIELMDDIPLAQLTEIIAAARMVVVPLKPSRISTGQSVLLQAMSLGKPVIATHTSGTEDYILHQQDGLLVPAGDPAALRLAIQSVWNDPGMAGVLGDAARRRIVGSHLPKQYVAAVARAIGRTAA
jgi:glycosyltransferase involved in cell wall biosynthesis